MRLLVMLSFQFIFENNYGVSVRVNKAKDLISADLNGKSDPL